MEPEDNAVAFRILDGHKYWCRCNSAQLGKPRRRELPLCPRKLRTGRKNQGERIRAFRIPVENVFCRWQKQRDVNICIRQPFDSVPDYRQQRRPERHIPELYGLDE